mmetsp:Transcript_42920/g.48753  ORF Transcript_42920/g.48753 Transcript_42920/m.48753 type:complete len:197 (+) Transcript_42920:93-683(+)|eukprot:CAMPEP_0194144530 /NCGR_PEP_ID=MMETSP0152-20130528/13581_1 /TAXON_ID=1049557 /ORGANISM="Thalassiothrix antarctica, Strain L6-D1" /LENGTH=196 /DNA_ID=CAMNT_0038844429 /DNA_START=11 /DNA_END=601 /DNA_ORIENTATION=+
MVEESNNDCNKSLGNPVVSSSIPLPSEDKNCRIVDDEERIINTNNNNNSINNEVEEDGTFKNEDNIEVEEESKLFELVEEVDMNNEDMDMLEWLVRKTIPIPKEYYWESSNDDVIIPWRIKLWHQTVGTLSSAVKWVDRIGKPIVDATGFASSRYEYVREQMTEEQIQHYEEIKRQKQLERQQTQQMNNLEEGGEE